MDFPKKIIKILFKTSLIVLILGAIGTMNEQARMLLLKTAGGLGIFLYGMAQMTTAFEVITGDRIKRVFEILIGNRFTACLAGIIVTSMIQSSSATTVMVVGFVNSAVMTLQQAAGIIIGANIGTTVTGQLIAFKISHYSHLFIIIGVLTIFLAKSRRSKMIGQALTGFGLLFIGMDFIKEVVAPLKESKEVIGFIAAISENIFAGIAVGAIFTVILQSSSATVALTMTMASSGLVSFPTAVALILGDNIGTTITALLASIPARRNAKRAALIHTIYNVLGASIIVIIFPYYINFVQSMSSKGAGIARLVANAHTFFNLANALFFIAFTGFLARVSFFILPQTAEEKERETTYLDKRLLNVPALAVAAARKQSMIMAGLAGQNLEESIKIITKFDRKNKDQILKRENSIDSAEDDIVKYLALIEEKSVTKEDSENIVRLIHFVNDMERVGDQCENIVKILEDKFERSIKFTPDAEKGLQEMSDLVLQMRKNAMTAFSDSQIEAADLTYALEKRVNLMEHDLRNDHIERLSNGKCNYIAGFFYLDIIEKLERIGDHFDNVADLVSRKSL